nr:cadherin-like domain-containing protein [Acidimicrobiia bacterium]
MLTKTSPGSGRRPASIRAWRSILVAVLLSAAVVGAAQSPAAAVPTNDDFAAAQLIEGPVGSLTSSNVDATLEVGEPGHGGAGGTASIWYRWTAPSDGAVTFDTCDSDYDTVLAVYTGGAVDTLTEVASNDDACGADGLASRVNFTATAGTVYHVAVDGYAGSTGTVVLAWAQGAAAADDEYTTIEGRPLTVSYPGVLANDTDADGDPLTVTSASDPAGGSVSIEPDGSFTYTPDAGTSGTDTFTYTVSDGTGATGTAAVTITLLAAPSPGADITAVDGLAYNYFVDLSLFGSTERRYGYGQVECDEGPEEVPAGCVRPGPLSEQAASPSVTCPEGGGTATVTDPDGARGGTGPAVIFGGQWPDASPEPPPSGPLTSGIDCQLGVGGYVTASTSVTLMPPGSTWTPINETTSYPHPGGVGPSPFIADEVRSTCTASGEGLSASTTIVNGILETSYDPATGEPIATEPVPENPEPGYTREGTLDHVGGDRWVAVFNEQIINPDGSITVNAVHMYLLGPIATGEMVIGSSTCGPLIAAAPAADCDGMVPTIVGTEGDDVLTGTGGDDVILGLGGNDTIVGGGGNDRICGGAGNDTIDGRAGDDRLFGGDGADTLVGAAGNDRLEAGNGADSLMGDAGDDVLLGENGEDRIRGGAGNDFTHGGDDDDDITDGDGADTIIGGNGDDTLRGGAGNDFIDGGPGADRLLGEAGDDTLQGGAGD